jgi:NAD(P)-dependent dehydrogenase (short-subunit alcohol dehydrogenase family)
MLTMSVLRAGLLDGRVIALAGGVAGSLRRELERLGARTEALDAAADGFGADEAKVGGWARARAPLHAVVYDSRPAFGLGGEAALTASLEQAWVAVREVANGALIPAEVPGKVVLIGPGPGAGPLAEAARAGLENLARTLSVEWARHGVSVACVAPGTATTEDELAELVSFLVSPAGEYFSGCRLDLGAVG